MINLSHCIEDDSQDDDFQHINNIKPKFLHSSPSFNNTQTTLYLWYTTSKVLGRKNMDCR